MLAQIGTTVVVWGYHRPRFGSVDYLFLVQLLQLSNFIGQATCALRVHHGEQASHRLIMELVRSDEITGDSGRISIGNRQRQARVRQP